MPDRTRDLDPLIERPYAQRLVAAVDSEVAPKGLDEAGVRFIAARMLGL